MKNMEYKVRITEFAEEELKNIYNYIYQNLKEPQIAKRVVNKIEQEIYRLKISPHLYQEVYIKPRNERYRRAIIGKYIILYKIEENKKEVLIFRIFYGKKDYLVIHN